MTKIQIRTSTSEYVMQSIQILLIIHNDQISHLIFNTVEVRNRYIQNRGYAVQGIIVGKSPCLLIAYTLRIIKFLVTTLSR